ncbi:MAG: CYTH domain-containing protein [Patescibacteria group bacterium]|nr:CYTH domain-containing protein [Patescibacteria group bacterium]
MKNEYEAKFLEINEEEIKSRLKSLGAKLVKPKQLLSRVIFENENTRADHSWIRLRNEGDRVTLTLKQVVDIKTIRGTREIEIIVDDFDRTVELLEGIGMEKKNYQENYREEWQLNGIIFDFDTWPDIPTFLEIEGPDESSVRQTAKKLGLEYKNAKFGSIDSIYLGEYGRNILNEENLVFRKN